MLPLHAHRCSHLFAVQFGEKVVVVLFLFTIDEKVVENRYNQSTNKEIDRRIYAPFHYGFDCFFIAKRAFVKTPLFTTTTTRWGILLFRWWLKGCASVRIYRGFFLRIAHFCFLLVVVVVVRGYSIEQAVEIPSMQR
jgi:hypothetical protein